MFDTLERIREKPRRQRQAIAFSVAGVITGLIFLLWVVSFFASLQKGQDVSVKSNSTFSFDAFTTSFNEASDTFKEGVGIIKEQIENTAVQLDDTEFTGSTIIEDKISTTPEEKQASTQVIIKEKKQENEITPSGVEIILVE